MRYEINERVLEASHSLIIRKQGAEIKDTGAQTVKVIGCVIIVPNTNPIMFFM